jgi:hypothetical protein
MLIAVGVDDNPEATDAMVLATTIARAIDAEIILATVYPICRSPSYGRLAGLAPRPKRCSGS